MFDWQWREDPAHDFVIHLSAYKWIILAVFGLIFVQSLSGLFLPTLMEDIVNKGVVAGDTCLHMEQQDLQSS